MSKLPDSTIDALIAEINILFASAAKADPEAVGMCLERLKKLSHHGAWISTLRRITVFRNAKSSGALSQTANRWIAKGRTAAAQPRKPTGVVSDAYVDLCGLLLAIDRLPEPLRSQDLEAEARKRTWSLTTILRKLRLARDIGPDALAPRPRNDRGCSREPEEVRRFFLDRRINKSTRHEMISLSIAATRRAFPELQISADALYRLNRTVARPLIKTREQRRKRYQPSGQWDVPHPNHTWVLDMARADIVVWDGDPDRKPYRPHLTAIIDECTQSCMWAVYTEETPSVPVLQGALLGAILPKVDPDWPQCGFPRYLHADNGKVQDSNWLRKVCASCHTRLDLMGEIRHSGVRSPWQNGHVENFFGIVHSHYESQLVAGYCGGDRRNPPACFIDPEGKGPRIWKQYPTLESLNDGFRIWVSANTVHLTIRTMG
jgi:transposase InsO family protein